MSNPPNFRITDACDICIHYYMETGMPPGDRCKKFKSGGNCYMICDDFIKK